jgi:hypothetical protein
VAKYPCVRIATGFSSVEDVWWLGVEVGKKLNGQIVDVKKGCD